MKNYRVKKQEWEKEMKNAMNKKSFVMCRMTGQLLVLLVFDQNFKFSQVV